MDLRNLRDYSFQLLWHSYYYNVLGEPSLGCRGGGGECVEVKDGVERASKAYRGINLKLFLHNVYL